MGIAIAEIRRHAAYSPAFWACAIKLEKGFAQSGLVRIGPHATVGFKCAEDRSAADGEDLLECFRAWGPVRHRLVNVTTHGQASNMGDRVRLVGLAL